MNWNGKHFLEQFLPSVTLSTYSNLEIIVADNASSDESVAFVKQAYPRIRIIHNKENFGFTRGYNEALPHVDADYYILLNSDVEVTPGWIEPMVALLESQPGIGACQPKLLSWANRNQFEYAGAAGGWMDQYGYPFTKGRVFDVIEEDKGQYDQQEPIFWASGAALFIRAHLFHESGGFDPYFFAHQEEIDLCWRMQLAGHVIYSCPSSIVYHVGGGTLHKSHPRKTFLNFRNNHIMLAKNLSWSKKWWIIPYRFCLDGVTAWKGLLSGDGGYFLAIVKAHFAFIGWVFSGQKKSVFPSSRKGKCQGMLQKNLVWQHFIKKKRTFSEIVDKRD